MENQTNNELQQAIDDITKSENVGADEAAVATSDLEAKIQSQMGVPPTPRADGMVTKGAPAEMPLPAGARDEMGSNKVTPKVTVSDVATGNVPVNVGQRNGLVSNDTMRMKPPVTASVTNTGQKAAQMINTEQKVTQMMGDSNKMTGESMMSESGLKEQMLRDLFPLMDKVELSPERRYEIYKEMLTTDHNLNMVQGAYEAAKALPDEKAKAEALLYLLDLV